LVEGGTAWAAAAAAMAVVAEGEAGAAAAEAEAGGVGEAEEVSTTDFFVFHLYYVLSVVKKKLFFCHKYFPLLLYVLS
jgi:hypothetical protein